MKSWFLLLSIDVSDNRCSNIQGFMLFSCCRTVAILVSLMVFKKFNSC